MIIMVDNFTTNQTFLNMQFCRHPLIILVSIKGIKISGIFKVIALIQPFDHFVSGMDRIMSLHH